MQPGFFGCYDLKPIGYFRYMFFWKTVVYKVVPNKDFPLTLRSKDGLLYRLRPALHSDLASIPRVMQLLVAKDEFPRAAIFHDDGYQSHGLFVSRDGGETYAFEELTRAKVDSLLEEGCGYDGVPESRAGDIWGAVRLCGWVPWNNATTLDKDFTKRPGFVPFEDVKNAAL